MNQSHKKFITAIMLSLMAIITFAQDSKKLPDKIIDKIVGSWKIQKILSGNKEVAKNPTSAQWIEFRSDGRYVNHATTLDSGSYRIEENGSIVFLESVKSDPSRNSEKMIEEWAVSFDKEAMIMERKKTGKREHSDKMKYIYARIGEAASAVN